MGASPIVLVLAEDEGDDGWMQPFAGGRIWCARPLAAAARRAKRPAPVAARPTTAADWSAVYDGPGLVDGGLHRLRSFLSTRGERRVDFEDGESFVIDAAGATVRRQGPGPADARSLERALGAPAALALATRGIYLLHASAIASRDAAGNFDRAIAFTARSGAGKSTLAAASDSKAGEDWRRIADDNLPVRLEPDAVALPHFPQLKLTPGDGYPADAPARLALHHLIEIEHSPAFRAIAIERLDPGSACLAMVRATVGARLFDPALLERHFASCATAGGLLPVHRLHFPTGLERLPEVLATIAATALQHRR